MTTDELFPTPLLYRDRKKSTCLQIAFCEGDRVKIDFRTTDAFFERAVPSSKFQPVGIRSVFYANSPPRPGQLQEL
jgi:hypothetical protein